MPSLENTICHKVSLLWLVRMLILPAKAEFSGLFRLLLSAVCSELLFDCVWSFTLRKHRLAHSHIQCFTCSSSLAFYLVNSRWPDCSKLQSPVFQIQQNLWSVWVLHSGTVSWKSPPQLCSLHLAPFPGPQTCHASCPTLEVLHLFSWLTFPAVYERVSPVPIIPLSIEAAEILKVDQKNSTMNWIWAVRDIHWRITMCLVWNLSVTLL